MDVEMKMLVALVRQMRAAQKAYFASRSREALIESKNAERQVDQMLDALQHRDGPRQQRHEPTTSPHEWPYHE